MKIRLAALAAVFAVAFAFGAQAQVPQYGGQITLDQAKKALAAGIAEAHKNS